MKIPSNKFTNNLVFFLILSFIIIIFYFSFFRYKEGAWGRTIRKQVKQPKSTNTNNRNSSSSSTLIDWGRTIRKQVKQPQSTNTNNRNSSSSSTLMTPTYSVETYSSTPTIVPPACNLMTNDRCSQNSGFCMWDSLTSGCLNKFDCTNLNQTTCSKQNYCTWNSSINKCSVKT
jgi:hypothetical protein